MSAVSFLNPKSDHGASIKYGSLFEPCRNTSTSVSVCRDLGWFSHRAL